MLMIQTTPKHFDKCVKFRVDTASQPSVQQNDQQIKTS